MLGGTRQIERTNNSKQKFDQEEANVGQIHVIMGSRGGQRVLESFALIGRCYKVLQMTGDDDSRKIGGW